MAVPVAGGGFPRTPNCTTQQRMTERQSVAAAWQPPRRSVRHFYSDKDKISLWIRNPSTGAKTLNQRSYAT
jgi:hypothetical protein